MKYQWMGILAMTGFALVGCEGGKQAAVLAMDEARLNIAAAEKAGAERFAVKSLSQAKSYINTADQKFSKKEYGTAKEIAAQANSEALSASVEAKENAIRAAAAAKKSTAPKKTPVKPIQNQKRK
ncbi:MAG: hypothetical protein JNK54_00485 [Elusimicrobia bacterium]|jgi:hypothetical protein|nr:hypothetical protein [Elusimicrobiota bacterium]